MSITTALDLIKAALKQIRVLGIGESPTSEESQDSLDVLNMMMESWSLDRLYVYTEGQHNFTFVDGQTDYTVGPSADFAMSSRPLKLVSAFSRSSGIDYPMTILTHPRQYDRLPAKSNSIMFPSAVWFEQTNPLGTLHFYPAPSAGSVYLRFWSQLQSFSSLTTEIELPPGYKECIVYNLGISLAGTFGIEPAGTVVSKARTSIARLKRYNTRALGVNSEVAHVNGRRYSIEVDGVR